MNIAAKTEYGIRALLAIAKNQGQIKRAEIAATENIPLPFLTQILQNLINSKLIKSQRGPEGGYVLAKEPAKISLLEVVTALQGPVMPRGCLDLGSDVVCNLEDSCRLKNIWSELKEANEAVLARYTLNDVLKNQKLIVR
jgi:Rrf2 family protein